MFKVEHIVDEDILKKLKQANFTKIQIGIESFLPEKILYFSKTKKDKEISYINKAKKIIDYCASIKIIPSSFIILTIPDKNFGLFDKINNDEGVSVDKLNLKTIEVPYLYKFENIKIAHFIDLLIKNKNTDKNNKTKTAEETEIEAMFVNIAGILNSLNASFDLYGTPEFLLYDIIDGLISAYNGNDDIVKQIITEYFKINDVNKFKNYLASGKLDGNKVLEIFSSIISGFDEIKARQEEKKVKGKFITGVLNERITSFIKQYSLN